MPYAGALSRPRGRPPRFRRSYSVDAPAVQPAPRGHRRRPGLQPRVARSRTGSAPRAAARPSRGTGGTCSSSKHEIDLADRWFEKRGDIIIFLARLLPVVRTFIAFPAGVARMNRTKFHVYTFVGSLPWCYALGYVGQRLGLELLDEHSPLKHFMHRFDAVIGGGIIARGGYFVWSRFKVYSSTSWKAAVAPCRGRLTSAALTRPSKRRPRLNQGYAVTDGVMAGRLLARRAPPRSAIHGRRRSPGRARGDPQGRGRLARKDGRPGRGEDAAAAGRASRPGATSTCPTCSRRPTSPSTTCATSACPGEYPFTRGVQPTMYRGRLWTMRMFAGFGTPEQTNARFKYLLAQGQTGLSTAFDFPTLMGYDSDSPRSLGEVGMCGVAVDTLRDMEVLFADIPLDRGHHVDDHQRAGHRPARVLRRARRRARHPARRASAARSRTTASRSSSRSTRGSSRRGRRCASSPT